MSGSSAPADSFRAFLPGLGRLMPSSLLGAAGCERLLDRIGDLPGLATAAQFGLEFRLDEAAAVADIAVPIEPGTELADLRRRSPGVCAGPTVSDRCSRTTR